MDFTGISLIVCYESAGSVSDIATVVPTVAANTVSWDVPAAVSTHSQAAVTRLRYSVRDSTTNYVYEQGEHVLRYSPLVD